jgi:hypothetical protein
MGAHLTVCQDADLYEFFLLHGKLPIEVLVYAKCTLVNALANSSRKIKEVTKAD